MSTPDQLRRLLWLIPAAGRPGGVGLNEAADALGVDVRRIQRDVAALTEREEMMPAGTAEGLQIELTADRIEIFTTGQFARPPRLTWRELFCVALGLRLLDGEGAEDASARAQAGDAGAGAHRTALLDRIETALGMPGARAADAPPVEPTVEGRAWHLDEVLAVLREAQQDRRPCHLRYLKPGAEAPEPRTLHVWRLVQAEGRWYAVGHDPEADGRRHFRADRILEADLDSDAPPFTLPDDADPAASLDGPRVFVSDAPREAVVRYAAAVTPWVRERFPGGDEEDGGGYCVTHDVADEGWLIRHVLEYGGAAEVLEPQELREAMARAVRGMIQEGMAARGSERTE